jgi:DNA-binding beta-propeller fold protein YncE
VADGANDRIQKFTSNGNFTTQWGRFGDNEGEFNLPSDVAVDSSGDVFVADSGNSRIQVFKRAGNQ